MVDADGVPPHRVRPADRSRREPTWTVAPPLAVSSTTTPSGREWTIYDPRCSADDRLTRWITAAETSVVEVDAWR
ncbi:DUF7511 domain-containing protein [Haloferacaceae archaeon DSL9]